MKDFGRQHYFEGIWVLLGRRWNFWGRYARKRIITVREFHEVYRTMG